MGNRFPKHLEGNPTVLGNFYSKLTFVHEEQEFKPKHVLH